MAKQDDTRSQSSPQTNPDLPPGDVEARLLYFWHAMVDGREVAPETYCEGLSPAQRRAFLRRASATRSSTMKPALPLARGLVLFDRYELRAEIGVGGFGQVWRALDLHLERRVALKYIQLRGETDGAAARLRSEMRALVSTDSRGVARILDIGMYRCDAFLVFELVRGQPVDRLIQNLRHATESGKPMTSSLLHAAIGCKLRGIEEDLIASDGYFRSVARIVADLLRTVQSIHEGGIRHRDIKPSNVMLRPGGAPVLLDFGLAAHPEHLTVADEARLSGSLPYLAPEQIASKRTGIDCRTDVYQAGLLLYELLTLDPAFEPVPFDKRGALCPPRDRNRRVPRDLNAICMQALHEETEKRYQTAAAFRRDLRAWLDGQSTPLAVSPGPRSRILRRVPYLLRRHRTWLQVAGAAGLGSLAGYYLGSP